MSSPEPRALREQAAAMRRAGDRLTLLRLRVANAIAAVCTAEDPAARELGEEIHEAWTDGASAELSRFSASLRSAAKRLETAAVAGERTSGRRLGGYSGAGFLGRGAEASHHVHDVAAFVGTRHGASIGGYPLLPEAQAGSGSGAGPVAPAHPSDSLGIATPAYEDED